MHCENVAGDVLGSQRSYQVTSGNWVSGNRGVGVVTDVATSITPNSTTVGSSREPWHSHLVSKIARAMTGNQRCIIVLLVKYEGTDACVACVSHTCDRPHVPFDPLALRPNTGQIVPNDYRPQFSVGGDDESGSCRPA